MKIWWIVLGAVALLLTTVLLVFAANFEFDWPQTNTDGTNLTDLAGGKVYVCSVSPCSKSNGVKTGPDIPAPAADPPAAAKGNFSLPTGQGFVFVTAFDSSGNESGESNVVPFDAVPPGTPTNLIRK